MMESCGEPNSVLERLFILTIPRRRLDGRAHRALAMRNAPVRAVRVNLIALQLGALFRSRIDDDAAGAVHFAGHEKRPLAAVAEKLDQHLDDVIIGVIVIIQQDDVITRNRHNARPLPSLWPAFANGDGDFGHSQNFLRLKLKSAYRKRLEQATW